MKKREGERVSETDLPADFVLGVPVQPSVLVPPVLAELLQQVQDLRHLAEEEHTVPGARKLVQHAIQQLKLARGADHVFQAGHDLVLRRWVERGGESVASWKGEQEEGRKRNKKKKEERRKTKDERRREKRKERKKEKEEERRQKKEERKKKERKKPHRPPGAGADGCRSCGAASWGCSGS